MAKKNQKPNTLEIPIERLGLPSGLKVSGAKIADGKLVLETEARYDTATAISRVNGEDFVRFTHRKAKNSE